MSQVQPRPHAASPALTLRGRPGRPLSRLNGWSDTLTPTASAAPGTPSAAIDHLETLTSALGEPTSLFESTQTESFNRASTQAVLHTIAPLRM